jgi:hypothetical protein
MGRKWEMGKWKWEMGQPDPSHSQFDRIYDKTGKWDSLTRPTANLIAFTTKRAGGGPFEPSVCLPLVE